ncbi:MAG: aminopeptidase [Phycisphaerae bacterium]|nr:aminopeptidase [Gemmatimonadaceae bacterium]
MTRLLKRVAAGLLGVVVLFLTLTPMGCYVSRAAYEEAKILSRRKPIARLVADSTTDKVTRAKLSLVLEARTFARDSLGLKTGESFTKYSKLDRDTLVLVLSAAYRDRLERRTWWFPVVGRFPYKGFFDFAKAKRTAEEMRAEGFDVTLGASSAFSTLGWFNDPLVSTTLAGDSVELVNTVIHELLHNTFFAKGHVPFNESFASFVGARGAERFFTSRGDTASARVAAADWHDDIVLGKFWKQLSDQVEKAYAPFPLDSSARRIAARDSVYVLARKQLVDSIGPQLLTYPPNWGARVLLNNSVLLSRRVYAQGLEIFDGVYEAEGRDVRKAIARVSEIAKAGKANPDSAVTAWVEAHPIPPN